MFKAAFPFPSHPTLRARYSFFPHENTNHEVDTIHYKPSGSLAQEHLSKYPHISAAVMTPLKQKLNSTLLCTRVYLSIYTPREMQGLQLAVSDNSRGMKMLWHRTQVRFTAFCQICRKWCVSVFHSVKIQFGVMLGMCQFKACLTISHFELYTCLYLAVKTKSHFINMSLVNIFITSNPIRV